MKIDYSLAPSWATEMFMPRYGDVYYFGNDKEYCAVVDGVARGRWLHSKDSLAVIGDKNKWTRVSLGVEENE